MRAKWMGAAAAVVIACGWASGASAALITQTYDFKATFNTSDPNNLPPYNMVSGAFTVTFDPTLSSQGPFAVDAFTSNLPASYGPVVFSTVGDTAVVGDDCIGAGSCEVITGTDKFFFLFSFDGMGFSKGGFGLTLASAQASGSYSARISVVSPVPVPTSAPMFGAAVLALGAAGYGLKRRNQSQAA